MKTSTRAVALTAVVGLAFGLGGCSSDDDNAGADSQPDVNAAPANTKWESLHGLKLPTAQDGPKVTDPVRFGYSHTPQGAVLSAINAQGQMAVVGDKDWPDLSRMALAPGKGRDQWAQQRALVTVSGTIKPDQAPQFKGFKVSDYSNDKAIVTLAVDYPKAGLAAYPVQLAWLSDDWRVVLPSQEDNIEPASIANLDGFTPYSSTEGEK